jgi:hypothetical protein
MGLRAGNEVQAQVTLKTLPAGPMSEIAIFHQLQSDTMRLDV